MDRSSELSRQFFPEALESSKKELPGFCKPGTRIQIQRSFQISPHRLSHSTLRVFGKYAMHFTLERVAHFISDANRLKAVRYF